MSLRSCCAFFLQTTHLAIRLILCRLVHRQQYGHLLLCFFNRLLLDRACFVNIFGLLQTSTGSWEPTYDTELWKEQKQLHLFVQDVQQGDAEAVLKVELQPVCVLVWLPLTPEPRHGRNGWR